MKISSEELSLLQEGFSKKVQLSIFLSDAEGVLVIPPSIMDNDSLKIFQQFSVKDYMQRTINYYGNINKPLLIEGQFEPFLGTKIVLCPVAIASKPQFYIWSSLFREVSENDHVLNSTLNEYKDIKAITADEVKQLQLEFEYYSGLIASIIINRIDYEKNDQQIYNLHEILDRLNKCNFISDEFFESLGSIIPESDFLGYAVRADNDSFQIIKAWGKDRDELLQQVFFLGEGFLGRVAATAQPGLWSNVDVDPRNAFFRRLNLPVKQLFCFPIYNLNVFEGVYFGGIYSEYPKLQNTNILKITADLLQLHVSNQRIRSEHNEMNSLMSIVFELYKTIKHTNQVKELFYLLLDAALNITGTSMVCLLYKDKFRTGKLHFLSRGVRKSELDDVTSNLIKRYFSEGTAISEEENLTTWETGFHVLEVPIMFKDSLVSVLCVEVRREKSGLSSYYSDAFRLLYTVLIQKLMIHDLEEHARIELLQDALQQWNPDLYLDLKEFHNYIAIILPHLSLSEHEQLQVLMICPILFYDLAILSTRSFSKELLIVIGEFQLWIETKKVPDTEVGQVLAIAYNYYKEYDSNSLTAFSTKYLKLFEKHTRKTMYFEADFSMNDKFSLSTAKNPEGILEQLSKRENEVLHLVAKGYGNRQIAKSLFISEHTVKNHISNIFQKLDIKDRNQATAAVYKKIYGTT